MINLEEIVSKYYKWLAEIIQNDLNKQGRLLIYNTLSICNRYVVYDNNFDSFMKQSEEVIDNMSFEDLKKMPKFHICLYTILNDRNSYVSQFIKEWIIYLKSNKIERRYDFPFYIWQNYENLPNIKECKFNYPDIQNIATIYSNSIELSTSFGTKNHNYKIDEASYYLLESVIMLAYKKDYNLILGNMIFRTLNYIDNEFFPALQSSYNYLILQQNYDGYFGHYMKKDFSLLDINSILNISFDCLRTILEKEYSEFRLSNEIYQKLIN